MNLSSGRPIGVFDSGIGGLTVANKIVQELPSEQIIYFGDTAHLPYGDKSNELIKSYALAITGFLLQEKLCKAVVIACNSASAAAYEELRDKYKGINPVINVIDPMIEAIIADDDIRKVGIIATKTTIGSGVYQEKLSRRKPSLQYAALATPLLASMIEEGFYNNDISHEVLKTYLSDPLLKDIDALILGCTHYPLIKNEIEEYYQHQIKVFDSSVVVANKLKRILEKEKLLNNQKVGKNKFYVSDYTESFEHTTRIFYGSEVHLEQLSIWKSR